MLELEIGSLDPRILLMGFDKTWTAEIVLESIFILPGTKIVFPVFQQRSKRTALNKKNSWLIPLLGPVLGQKRP